MFDSIMENLPKATDAKKWAEFIKSHNPHLIKYADLSSMNMDEIKTLIGINGRVWLYLSRKVQKANPELFVLGLKTCPAIYRFGFDEWKENRLFLTKYQRMLKHTSCGTPVIIINTFCVGGVNG